MENFETFNIFLKSEYILFHIRINFKLFAKINADTYKRQSFILTSNNLKDKMYDDRFHNMLYLKLT